MFFSSVTLLYEVFGEKSKTTLEYDEYEIVLEGENATLYFEDGYKKTFPIKFLKKIIEEHEINVREDVSMCKWEGEPVAFFHEDTYNKMSNGEFRHIFSDKGYE